jgi:hypothetical protein
MQARAAQLKEREATASNKRFRVFEDIDRRRITATREEEARRRVIEQRALKLILGLFTFILVSVLIVFLSGVLRG